MTPASDTGFFLMFSLIFLRNLQNFEDSHRQPSGPLACDHMSSLNTADDDSFMKALKGDLASDTPQYEGAPLRFAMLPVETQLTVYAGEDTYDHAEQLQANMKKDLDDQLAAFIVPPGDRKRLEEIDAALAELRVVLLLLR